MKPILSSVDWSKRVATTVVTAAIVVAPFVNATTARADDDSPRYAQAQRRAKKDKNKNKNKNRDRNERNLTGVVTRDLSGQRFELRTDNGRVVEVRLRDEKETNRLSRGDRVRVEGQFRNNGVFVATDVDILTNRDNNNDERTLTGVVTRDLRGDRFDLRTDSGRRVTVQLRQEREPRRLSRGDRVRIEGEFRTAGVFVADDLDILSNNGNTDRNERSLTGVVTRDSPGRRFEMRTDSGRIVDVQLHDENEPNSLSRGDRVRVEGRFRTGNVFSADDLTILRNNDGNGNTQRVNFAATVLNVTSSTRLRVRGDNDRTYVIESRNAIRGIDDGDRVRIIGDANGNRVRVSEVRLLNNTDNGSGVGAGRRISFNGVVTHMADDRRSMVVMTGDNRRMTVRSQNAGDFRIGQRVNVSGIAYATYVAATRIARR